MGQLKPNDYKAIGWYAELLDYRLTLSTPPFIYFRTPEGKLVERSLVNIRARWEAHVKEERKKQKGA